MELHVLPAFNLPLSLILATVVPLLGCILCGRWKIPPPFPKDIPWAGRRDEVFASIRARFRGWPSMKSSLSEGYNKFNRHGQPFIHANWSFRPQVILPVKDFEWMLRLPDSKISVQEVMNDSEGLAHLYKHRSAIEEKVGAVSTSQHLTKDLDRIQPELYEELKDSLDRVLGLDTEQWRSLALHPAMDRVVGQVSARIMFGSTLCRDEGFLRAMARFTKCFGVSIIATAQLMPWFLQSALSVFFRIPVYLTFRRVAAYIEPLMMEWDAQMDQEDTEPPATGSEVPYNMTTTLLRTARRLSNLSIHQLTWTIAQAAALPFTSVSASACNLLVDVASYPPEKGLYSSLQQEALSTLDSSAAWRDPANFAKLRFITSTVQESLRLSPQLLRAANREVIHPDGLTLPTGQHLPRGTWVGASALDIHLDERFYPDPTTYDPFRFVKATAAAQETDAAQAQARVSTSSTFLSFSSGRHAW
ncbi:cytochrome P450 [Aspergillus egyptiacus]|nr:cytochrome P450 [Aspergillus egyptiacus]